ncbi:MAG: helix-turn-helix transcriptional regulator [Gemmatimonadota bacterium]|nr:helix-turn-helix transcriptional regulator [Gemmatimonadota bacterium]
MTGSDITRRREAIGLSLDALAESLGEHQEQVAAWERIEGPIPRTLARRLEWCLALAERDAAIRDAGIPDCEVVAAIVAAQPPAATPQDAEALTRKLDAHATGCAICQQRQAVWDAQPPLPPPPLPAWVAIFGRLGEVADRLPPYLRPALWGALAFGAMTLIRVAILLPAGSISRAPQAAAAVGFAVLAGGYGGAIGGIAHHLARRWSLTWGRAGDFFTGVIVAGAVALGVGLPLAAFGGDPMFRSAFWWGVLAIGSLLVGIILGFRTFRREAHPD